MRKLLFFIGFVLFFGFYGYSQVSLAREKRENVNNATEWIQEMYKDYPNLGKLIRMYDLYYSEEIFEKTYDTQYYKELLSTYFFYMKKNGEIDFESYNKTLSAIKSESSPKRKLFNETSEIEGDWADIGLDVVYKKSQIPLTRNSNIYSIAQSSTNPQILYAGTEGGGLWKTTNKGETWQAVGTENSYINKIYAIEINPNNENIVLIGTPSGIFRTSDGGVYWELVSSAKTVECITYNKDATVVFATRRGTDGLYKSTDNGFTWSVAANIPFYDVKAHPTDLNVLYAVRYDIQNKRVLPVRTDDKGLTWTDLSNGWYLPEVPDLSNGHQDPRVVSGARIAVTNAAPDNVYVLPSANAKEGDNRQTGVYMSTNKGDLWTNLLPQEGGPYHNAESRLSDGSRLPKDPNGAFYLNGYDQGYYNMDIVVSPIDPNEIFIGHIYAFKINLDGTQEEVSTGHPDQQQFLFDKEDPNIMWVANDGGLIKYDINTKSIENVAGIRSRNMWGFSQAWNKDSWGGGAYHNGDGGRLEHYPAHTGHFLGGAEAYTGTLNPIINAGYYSDLSSTFVGFPDDYTKQFFIHNKNIKKPNRNKITRSNKDIAWHPHYYKTMFQGVGNSLWRSEDLGATYTEIKGFNENIRQVVVSRVDPTILMVSTEQGLYKSTNNGDTWSMLTLPNGVLSSNMYLGIELSGTDADKMWFFSNLELYQSNDGGNSWSEIEKPSEATHIRTVVHQLGTEETLYLASPSQIYVRASGNNWSNYSKGLPAATSILTIEPFYKDELLRYAGTHGVWSSPLKESSVPIAQPTVAKRVFKQGEDIQFDSYSVVKEDGTVWAWSFPGASYVSSTAIRNPEVMYDNPGVYDVTLTITDSQGRTSTKTVKNMVNILRIESVSNVIIEDSYVRGGGFANTNFGTENTVNLKNDSGSYLRRPIIKLDISQLGNIEENATVNLEIPVVERRGISVIVKDVTSNNWNQDNVTYNNFPSFSEDVVSVNPISAEDSIAILNITQLVLRAQARNENELSLALSAIEAGGSNYITFQSKEAGDDAKIKVISNSSTLSYKDYNYETSKVLAYPSYFDTNLYLKLKEFGGEYELKLYDLNGRLVSKLKIKTPENATTMDISAMARKISTGPYILKVIRNGKLKNNIRIVKK